MDDVLSRRRGILLQEKEEQIDQLSFCHDSKGPLGRKRNIR